MKKLFILLLFLTGFISCKRGAFPGCKCDAVLYENDVEKLRAIWQDCNVPGILSESVYVNDDGIEIRLTTIIECK